MVFIPLSIRFTLDSTIFLAYYPSRWLTTEVRVEQLKELRTRKGYSQQELADLSDVAQHTISEIELGRRKPQGRTLRKMAAALGVEVSDLLEVQERPKVPRIFSAEWALKVTREKMQREIKAADTARLHKLLAELAGDEYTHTREEVKAALKDEEKRALGHRRVEALSRAADVWAELRERGEESPEKGLPVLRNFLELVGYV